MSSSKPLDIHLRMVEVMRRCSDSEGMTCGQMREELEREGLRAEEQTHLDRRWRDLPKWFVIRKTKTSEVVGGRRLPVVKYAFEGERKQVTDQGSVSLKARAAVIHAAHGQCEMCGSTVARHGITLVVDHKLPRDWGGTNERENLWAICEQCNAGKKAHFASLRVDPLLMKRVMAYKSVHVRIGELLKAFGIGTRTPSYLIELVSDENQDDWKKRLRELRYPVIGWDIRPQRYTDKAGKVRVDYILVRFKEWPDDDPTGLIRRFEKERERRNRADID